MNNTGGEAPIIDFNGFAHSLPDERCVLREGYQAFLAGYPELEVVRVTEDTADESLQREVSEATPDVVLLCLEVLDPAAVEKLELIRKQNSNVVIVLVCDQYDAEGLDALWRFSLGATTGYAYLQMDSMNTGEHLAMIISSAVDGHITLDPVVVESLLATVEPNPTLFTTLAPWEREVLKWMARGAA